MELAESIKMLAMQQVEGTYPMSVMFATVTSESPVGIQVDSKLFSSEFVIVPEYLTDRNVDIEDSGTEKTITIKNALKVGDKVIVLRADKGQKYIIMDRIGG